MALVNRADYQLRQTNKEPEWSGICNNVFDQYLDQHDDIFAFDADQQRGRSSSSDSCNLFDFSGSSEQSHQTDATSPIPSWEATVAVQDGGIEKQHPKPKEPLDFWQKKLKALEQNAAECELRQQKLRTTKSHPDFLSLGGHPSPPVLPCSPTDQSSSAQRRVSRSLAANGKKRNITGSAARSVSRGRPSGVSKAAVAGSTNPYATVRKCSASPAKMMNPSRYRAGFQDVWQEKLHLSPEKFRIRVPTTNNNPTGLAGLPFSPPASGRSAPDEHFAAFGSPATQQQQQGYDAFSAYDEQMSPLATTFQQAHIHTPVASPAIAQNAAAHARNGYFIDPIASSGLPYPATATTQQQQKIPLNDTAPLFPERTSSLAPHRIQDFDFGFDTSLEPDPFSPVSSFGGPIDSNYITTQSPSTTHFTDPFGGIDTSILPTTEPVDFGGPAAAGLGISCNPSHLLTTHPFISPDTTTIHPSSTIAANHHSRGQSMPAAHTYPFNHPALAGLPRTPRRGRTHNRHDSRARSPSPSPPPPTTEPRPLKHHSRSSHHPTNHHRRAKSAHNTPSDPNKPRGGGGGGFVNFTPHDSSKILSGVAPSGSSKTKARREKEAADKRRRLSSAAVKAVRDAGGDLSLLREGGLVL